MIVLKPGENDARVVWFGQHVQTWNHLVWRRLARPWYILEEHGFPCLALQRQVCYSVIFIFTCNGLKWFSFYSPVKDTVIVNDRWGQTTRCHHGDTYTCHDKYNPGEMLGCLWCRLVCHSLSYSILILLLILSPFHDTCTIVLCVND